MMSVSIRPAVPHDVENVIGVIRAVYDEYGFTWDAAGYHADLYDLQRHYLDQGHAFWVAEEEGGALIGTAALRLFAPLPGEWGASREVDGELRLCGCDCSLQRLYVHPSARRQGAGRKLMESVLQNARQRGRRGLEIWSDKRFGEAHQLYHKLGAVSVADRICHDPDQSPEWGLLIRL
jgi:putative acetyltransferase